MDVRLGRAGVEVKLPHFTEKSGELEWWSGGVLGGLVIVHHSITPILHYPISHGLERIHDPIASIEEDQRAAIHRGEGGR